MYKKWVKDRDVGTYCPLEGETVVLGWVVASHVPGEVVGEFWYDENHRIKVELYECPLTKSPENAPTVAKRPKE